MPYLWVKIPKVRKKYGPYKGKRYDNIKTFARIGSQRGHPREVWSGTSNGPTKRIRRYEKGKRTFPANVTKATRQAERRKYAGLGFDLGYYQPEYAEYNVIREEENAPSNKLNYTIIGITMGMVIIAIGAMSASKK